MELSDNFAFVTVMLLVVKLLKELASWCSANYHDQEI